MSFRKFHEISDDDPLVRPTTGHELTTGNMARLAMSTAQTLAKYEAMNAQVADLQTKLAELRAGLDAMQAQRERDTATKAASEAFRKSQQ